MAFFEERWSTVQHFIADTKQQKHGGDDGDSRHHNKIISLLTQLHFDVLEVLCSATSVKTHSAGNTSSSYYNDNSSSSSTATLTVQDVCRVGALPFFTSLVDVLEDGGPFALVSIRLLAFLLSSSVPGQLSKTHEQTQQNLHRTGATTREMNPRELFIKVGERQEEEGRGVHALLGLCRFPDPLLMSCAVVSLHALCVDVQITSRVSVILSQDEGIVRKVIYNLYQMAAHRAAAEAMLLCLISSREGVRMIRAQREREQLRRMRNNTTDDNESPPPPVSSSSVFEIEALVESMVGSNNYDAETTESGTHDDGGGQPKRRSTRLYQTWKLMKAL